MPRSRKKADDGAITADHHETPEGPVTMATQEAPANDVDQAFRDAGITTGSDVQHPDHGDNSHEQSNDHPASDSREGDEKPKFRPIRETFTSSKTGVHAGEDKRFRNPQVFVAFDDDKRAETEEKEKLKEAGLRYRPNDKGYSALATPATREARDQLAQKFAERRLKGDEGQER